MWCHLAMTRYVALLRAVNVGRRRVAMQTARRLLEKLGYDDVGSFVNSGNLLFSADGGPVSFEREIRATLEKQFGFEITTFVRSAAQLRRLVNEQPFQLAGDDTNFVLFPHTPMSSTEEKAVRELANDHDELVISGRDVHWLIHSKSTETTLGPRQWLKALPDNPTTARNITMLTRLVQRL